MGYISPEREEEYRDEKFEKIFYSFNPLFCIVFMIYIIFMGINFKEEPTFLNLFFHLLKITIFSLITMTFYMIISLFILSISFHFEKKILYFFYKRKYRNNMNDVNYAYLCTKLKTLILNNKMSKKKIEKETTYLLKKNTLRNEEIDRNLNILEKKESK